MSHEDLSARLYNTSQYVRSYDKKMTAEARINAFNLLTNKKTVRPIRPRPDQWVDVELAEVVETEHPYAANTELSGEYQFASNVKFVRFVFDQIETESRYDNFEVFDEDYANKKEHQKHANIPLVNIPYIDDKISESGLFIPSKFKKKGEIIMERENPVDFQISLDDLI